MESQGQLVAPQTSGKAIASLVLGFFSLLVPAAVVGIVLGHVARGEIRRSAGRLKGSGMALAGLIMSYSGVALAPILIILAIAVPTMNNHKMNNQLMASHEMAAIRQVQTIHQAEVQYYSQFGKYADSLAALGPPANCATGPAAADLIPKVLAEGKNSGYIFSVTPSATGYSVTAIPEAFNSSGRRTFYSDQTLVIHNNWTQDPATAESPEIK